MAAFRDYAIALVVIVTIGLLGYGVSLLLSAYGVVIY